MWGMAADGAIGWHRLFVWTLQIPRATSWRRAGAEDVVVGAVAVAAAVAVVVAVAVVGAAASARRRRPPRAWMT